VGSVTAKFADKLIKEGKQTSKKITSKGAKLTVAAPLTDGLPNDDVIAAYKEIQDTLEEIRPLVDKSLPTYRSIVERLEAEGYIMPEASQLFNSLREARNAVKTLENLQISTTGAEEYQQQAELLIGLFKETLGRLGNARPRAAE
jgi:hypothetical protein